METVGGVRERAARDGAETPPRHRRPATPIATALDDDEHDDAPAAPPPSGRRLDVFA